MLILDSLVALICFMVLVRSVFFTFSSEVDLEMDFDKDFDRDLELDLEIDYSIYLEMFS